MQVIRKSLAEGARVARGFVVIIDVFRAFSCQPLFFHFKARKVILEADPQRALGIKEKHPGCVLVGEENEVPIDGADLGNSPSEIVLKGEAYFRDKMVVHRTTAGVTGAVAALDNGAEVILGSYLTARAVAEYARGREPEPITLVAMGDRAEKRAPEDEACADYMEHLLTDRPYNHVETLKKILFQPTAQKFIRGTREYLPREDPIFCLQRDIFDFVLGAKREDEYITVFRKY